MGLFSYTLAGGGIMLVGAWESFISSSQSLKQNSPSTNSARVTSPTSVSGNTRAADAGISPSSVTSVAISVLSFVFVTNSFVSLSDALNAKDRIGSVLQLEVITMAVLFLFYSSLGLLKHFNAKFQFPSALLNVLFLFAFGEEFFFFYVRRKDPDGVENRYYDLFLVPVGICIFCTFLELKSPRSYLARLGRGVGLILQGMWIVQMGFSFFSELVLADGCSLQKKSRGNYTLTCKGHPEYHRGRAIATLQFNCHLALLVTLGVLVYAIVCKKHGIRRESTLYRPLGSKMQQLDHPARFTLDSDDELDDDENGIKEERSVEMQKAIVPVSENGINGYGNHP